MTLLSNRRVSVVCGYLLACLLLAAYPGIGRAQVQPAPSMASPMEIDFSSDPILSLSRRPRDPARFMALVEAAVLRAPSLAEAEAGRADAKASLRQVRAGYLPTIDLSFSRERSLSSRISNDPLNIIERLRGRGRTDAIASANQTLVDFGATRARVRAAGARLTAADAEIARVNDDVILQAISIWLDVDNFRMLEALATQLAERQAGLAKAIDLRVGQGASAPAEQVRVQAYLASTALTIARYSRDRQAAEARFEDVFGQPAPGDLTAVPRAPFEVLSRLDLEGAIEALPMIRAARADADAAGQDARALRADNLPSITATLDAGRYGVYETPGDYDIRARVTVRKRLFGTGLGRADQGLARAIQAQAKLSALRNEAVRNAQIAQSDVLALNNVLSAAALSYQAARQLRDVQRVRFSLVKGAVFDLISAEEAYSQAAEAYVSALNESESAGYVLLARRGDLAKAIDLQTSRQIQSHTQTRGQP